MHRVCNIALYFFILVTMLPSSAQSGVINNNVLIGWHLAAMDSYSWQGEEFSLELIGDFSSQAISYIRVPSDVDSVALIKALRSDPRVKYAELDQPAKLAVVPNDPDYSQQWALDSIFAADAWELNNNCSDVIIAMVDTGVDIDHPELQNNLWRNSGEVAGNGVDDDGNGIIDDLHGYNVILGNGNPDDDNGHGTHVAGIIAAQANNGQGISGLCWNARLMALKFLDRFGSGSVLSAVLALNYAIAQKQPNVPMVINNSWVVSRYSQALADVISEAEQKGILIVAAAGNSGQNSDVDTSYPAALRNQYGNVIAVANSTDSAALFNGIGSSNYGISSVDLAAPGTNILSTYMNAGYKTLTGTSMATPHVTALSALLLQQQPLLTPIQLRARLMSAINLSPSLQGRLVVPGVVNAMTLLSNQYVEPVVLMRSYGTANGRVIAGENAWLQGNNLSQISQLSLSEESVSFEIESDQVLRLIIPETARHGYLQGNQVSNPLYLHVGLPEPTQLVIQEDIIGVDLSWNAPLNSDVILVERAERNRSYQQIAEVAMPMGVFRDNGANNQDGFCYRLRSRYDYSSPIDGSIKQEYSAYSDVVSTTVVGESVRWITHFLGSVVEGRYFSSQLLGSGFGLNFNLVSGTLPAGVTLSKYGLLSGISDQKGTYTFDVKLSGNDLYCPELKTFILKVHDNATNHSVTSDSGEGYHLNINQGIFTELQWRKRLQGEPEMEEARYHILDFKIDASQELQKEGYLLSVENPLLGHPQRYKVYALTKENQWQLLESGNGLQQTPNDFSLAFIDNGLIEVDSRNHHIEMVLAIVTEEDLLIALGGDDNRCFIASAIYTDPMAPQLTQLRTFRDQWLGDSLVKSYYANSPSIAVWLQQHPQWQLIVKGAIALLLWVLNYYYWLMILFATLFCVHGFKWHGLRAFLNFRGAPKA